MGAVERGAHAFACRAVGDDGFPAGLQELKVEDQEQRNILVDDRTDYANTVPLEEALIVDNPGSVVIPMLSHS